MPVDLQPGPALEVRAIERSLRAGAARLGAIRLGPPIEGDGSTTTTFEVFGEDAGAPDANQRAPASISVTLDRDTGEVVGAAFRIADREAPAEAW